MTRTVSYQSMQAARCHWRARHTESYTRGRHCVIDECEVVCLPSGNVLFLLVLLLWTGRAADEGVLSGAMGLGVCFDGKVPVPLHAPMATVAVWCLSHCDETVVNL